MDDNKVNAVRDEEDRLLGFVVAYVPDRFSYILANDRYGVERFTSASEAHKTLMMHYGIVNQPLADMINEPIEMLRLRLKLLHVDGILGACGQYDDQEKGFNSCVRCEEFMGQLLEASYWRPELRCIVESSKD